MSLLSAVLRVTSVRSRGTSGGAIFAGKTEAGASYVVVAGHEQLRDSGLVERAQVWNVSGEAHTVSYSVDGVTRSEEQIRATSLELQRPSGNNLVAWIAQSPDCRGVGEVRARRLWERFGTELADILEAGDVGQLAVIVGEEPALALIAAFAKHGVAQTLLWLDQIGLPRALAASVANYWGRNAKDKVHANPYALVSFCAEWRTLDDLAQKRFGIPADDDRRLVAAVEETLYRAMDRGDTALLSKDAHDRLRRLLGRSDLVERAIVAALAAGRVSNSNGLLQSQGMARIEETVAATFMDMLDGRSSGQGEMFTVETPQSGDVQRSVALYESMHAIELTVEQRQAVLTCATSRLSLILGGAGTGKTTVLKALCHVIDRVSPASNIYQLALAGRAAQRMTQATGRQSKTIAAFLLDETIAPGSTVLIDEVSMVDVILMYRLLRHLPDAVRVVLIGDPGQLPPIGPGLVLHALVGQPFIPQTTLKTVMRQAAASGIPSVAAAVREHRVPPWTPYAGKGAGVSAVGCVEANLDAMVATLYGELGGTGQDYSVQVLCATRAGAGGVRALNALLHSLYAAKRIPVQSYSGEFGVINEQTADHLGLFVDDLVLFTTNDYTLDLRNGSLGRITAARAPVDTKSVVCVADFEGIEYALTAAHLRHVTHAYAVTIHKAQGSQFERVIVAVRKSKILDNSLLYTGLTRAVEQVVLAGDIDAAQQAVLAPSSASKRTTRLPSLLSPAPQLLQ